MAPQGFQWDPSPEQEPRPPGCPFLRSGCRPVQGPPPPQPPAPTSDFCRSRVEQCMPGPVPSLSGEDGPPRADTAAGFQGGWIKGQDPAPHFCSCWLDPHCGKPSCLPALASTQPQALRRGPCHLGQGPLLGPAKPWVQRHHKQPLEHKTCWARPAVCPQDRKYPCRPWRTCLAWN